MRRFCEAGENIVTRDARRGTGGICECGGVSRRAATYTRTYDSLHVVGLLHAIKCESCMCEGPQKLAFPTDLVLIVK